MVSRACLLQLCLGAMLAAVAMSATSTSRRPSSSSSSSAAGSGSNRAGNVRVATLPTTTKAPNKKMCGNPPYVFCAECSEEPFISTTATIRPVAGGTTTKPASTTARSARRLIPTYSDSVPANKRSIMYFDIGDVVYYNPINGANGNYTLSGNTSVTCLPTGKWSSPPKCVRKSTCTIPSVSNANCGTVGASVAVGASVTCTCRTGFVAYSGSGTITCNRGNTFSSLLLVDDGAWIHPMCKAITTTSTTPAPVCTMKPVIQYGSCNGPANGRSVFNIGETTTCQCQSGCTLSSTAPPVCTAGADRPRFTNVPSCRCVQPGNYNCSVPPEVPNAGCGGCEFWNTTRGKPRQTSFFPGDTITFECRRGFRMEGNAMLRCQKSGQWTTPPRCVTAPATPARVKCRGMPTMTNGRCYLTDAGDADEDELDDNEFIVGREVKCDCGNAEDELNLYTMTGSEFVNCQENGQWSARPTCTRTARTTTPTTTTLSRLCTLPSYPNAQCSAENENGDTLFEVNEKVQCECNTGFRPTNPAGSILTCQAGRVWSNAAGPGCVGNVRCTSAPILANGNCEELDDVARDGETVDCECYDGFQLAVASQNKMTCTRTGAWVANATCVPSTAQTMPPASRICTNAPAINYGLCPLPAGKTYATVGQSVTCSCSSGRTFVDAARTSTMCRGNNQWTQPLPSCR